MRLHPIHLLRVVLFQFTESVKTRRRTSSRTHLRGQLLLEFVFPHFQQAAIRVVDDDEFLRVEQVMRNNQRAQSVVGRNPARIADHVRVSWMQSQAALKKDSGIHTSQYGYPPYVPDGQISQIKDFYIQLV